MRSVLLEKNNSSSMWNASLRVHVGGFISMATLFQVIDFELKLMSTPSLRSKS